MASFASPRASSLGLLLATFLSIAFCHQQAPVVKDLKTRIVIPNLTATHYQFWLRNHPRAFVEFQQICSQAPHPLELSNLTYFKSLHANLSLEDPRYLNDLNYGKTTLNAICSKIDLVTKSCWGYESNCQIIHLMPECYGSSSGQTKSEQEQKIAWFSQADFGYILEQRKEMSKFCAPDKRSNDSIKSSLECTKHFKTCRGDNLFIKFENIPKNGSLSRSHIRNHSVVKGGNVGGWNCDLQARRIQEEGGQKGELQSWFNELEGYNLIQDTNTSNICDETIDKQAIFIKLDSTSNMYHYFCNFLNLYATIHLNNKFSDDNQIIIWDNQLPRSNFEKMWTVFSRNPLMSIGQFEGKRVCFKKFIFAFLPRMVQGLYYNTPLVPGCSKTGLFDAFNKHVNHKLDIPQEYNLDLHQRTQNKLIRVTLVSRSTSHRRILNQNELTRALANRSDEYVAHSIDFAESDFFSQLKVVQNTDILVGIHGAGLTYSLFLPDWAALFELHDCSDKCYSDLARLRGVSYFSPADKQTFATKQPVDDQTELSRLNASSLIDHEKFSNYLINVKEFLNTIEHAAKSVRAKREKSFEGRNSKESKTNVITEPSRNPSHVEL